MPRIPLCDVPRGPLGHARFGGAAGGATSGARLRRNGAPGRGPARCVPRRSARRSVGARAWRAADPAGASPGRGGDAATARRKDDDGPDLASEVPDLAGQVTGRRRRRVRAGAARHGGTAGLSGPGRRGWWRAASPPRGGTGAGRRLGADGGCRRRRPRRGRRTRPTRRTRYERAGLPGLPGVPLTCPQARGARPRADAPPSGRRGWCTTEPPYGQTARVRPAQYGSRSRRLYSLPLGSRGISGTKSMLLGRL